MSCCEISLNDMLVCSNWQHTSMCFVSLEYGMLMCLSPSRLSPLAPSTAINGYQRLSTAINRTMNRAISACAHIPSALPTVLRNRCRSRSRYVYHYDFLASVQEGPQPGILVEGSRRHEQRRCQRIVRLCQYTHSYTYIRMHPLLSHNLWT